MNSVRKWNIHLS